MGPAELPSDRHDDGAARDLGKPFPLTEQWGGRRTTGRTSLDDQAVIAVWEALL
ncbi:hypothetical protein GCM10010251_32660 [Streptomyces aurantiogriseus]|uniref:Uncharacterized protein n=1 Tax=Streptomyces aurantiogriseus TaxID=66870 RepID=A0A918CC48_9ACTN|nr:hypothetical protein GCM10010251_32660 [Streptomyces aurantiogriseus]